MPIALRNYYHFVATFEDGAQIIQDDDDVSSIDPNKSQFYDALQYSQDTSPLASFVLVGEHTYGVDLRDGHFEVNGTPFFPYRADREVLTDFRVIYFRNVRHDKNIETGVVVSYMGYTLGFQANDESGASVKHIMKIG